MKVCKRAPHDDPVALRCKPLEEAGDGPLPRAFDGTDPFHGADVRCCAPGMLLHPVAAAAALRGGAGDLAPWRRWAVPTGCALRRPCSAEQAVIAAGLRRFLSDRAEQHARAFAERVLRQLLDLEESGRGCAGVAPGRCTC